MNNRKALLLLIMIAIYFAGLPEVFSAQPISEVEINNFAFNPASITISQGTTVRWTNNDTTAHTVTSDVFGIFDSSTLNPGQTFEFIFNEMGTYNYHCSIHSFMQAEIIVTPPQNITQGLEIQLEQVADNLTAPIALVSPDDMTGRRFIVDQIGLIKILTTDGLTLTEPFMDIRSKIVNLDPGYDERGLLGMAFHPDFKLNGRFFVYYSVPLRSGAPDGWNHTSVISEFKVLNDNPNKSDLSSERILLQVDKPQSNHNGGQITFGPDGYLYIPVGDGGGANDVGIGHPSPGNGQNISTPLGKILRIDVDSGNPYNIPADNPFVGKEGLDEIFAYGFRNPFHISFDAGGTHSLFAGDSGQNAWEEVDIVTKGGNFGWNIKEGTHCFDKNNPDISLPTCPSVGALGEPLIDPIIEYANARQPGGIGVVVIGGYVYRGKILPELKGQYIFGDFSNGFIEGNGSLFEANSSSPEEIMWTVKELRINSSENGRIGSFVRSFGEDEDHEIYVLTSMMLGPSNNTGKIFKIKPTIGIIMDRYLPSTATPEERKSGVIKAMDDYFDNGVLTKYELLSVLDAYFA